MRKIDGSRIRAMVRHLALESVIPTTFVDSVYHRLKTSSEVGQSREEDFIRVQ